MKRGRYLHGQAAAPDTIDVVRVIEQHPHGLTVPEAAVLLPHIARRKLAKTMSSLIQNGLLSQDGKREEVDGRGKRRMLVVYKRGTTRVAVVVPTGGHYRRAPTSVFDLAGALA